MQIDMPTRADIERLAAARDPLSISIYLPTSQVPAHDEENRLRARALFEQAIERVGELTDKRTLQALKDDLYTLLDDREFWDCCTSR
ncbi:hypothetical protein [Microbacterium sp. MMO-56]|uniref:hypothetical protein n=1 Tax=Microbacterium sp. MMO-56 TaxID=3081281 RepID=UPI0030161C34